MWFIFALSSAILASFRKVNDKRLSYSVHHLHLGWMMKLAALPVLLIAATTTGQLTPPESLPVLFWATALLGVFVVTPLDTVVYLRSLKYGQLSKTAPLISLWPVLMIFMGILFLGQVPSAAAMIAIMVIVSGVYLLNSNGNTNIFRNIWDDIGTRYGAIGILTVSVNTTLSAVAVAHSSPLFYAFWTTLLSVLVQHRYAQIVAPGKFRHVNVRMLAGNGTLQGTASILYFYAVSTGPIAYVTAIRSLSATISAVIGARVFNEGFDARKRIALGFIAIGAVLLGFVR